MRSLPKSNAPVANRLSLSHLVRACGRAEKAFREARVGYFRDLSRLYVPDRYFCFRELMCHNKRTVTKTVRGLLPEEQVADGHGDRLREWELRVA